MAPLYDPQRVLVPPCKPACAMTEAPDRFSRAAPFVRWTPELVAENLLACLTTIQDELEDLGVLLDLLGSEPPADQVDTVKAAEQAYTHLAPAIKHEVIERLVPVIRACPAERMKPAEQQERTERQPVSV